MKINQNSFLTLMLVFSVLSGYSQDPPVQCITVDRKLILPITDSDKVYIRDSSDMKTLFVKIMSLKFNQDSTIRNLFSDFVDSGKHGWDIADGHAIVIVRYAKSKVNPKNPNWTKLNPITITTDNGKYSSYILNKKNILLVFLDTTRLAESFKINNKTSYFSNSLNGIIKIVEDSYFAQKKDAIPDALSPETIRFVLLDRKKIVSPSDISFAVPVKDKSDKTNDFIITDNTPYDTVKITIHEKNHFSFSVGLNGSFLNKQNFKINGDTVSVSLDSAQKKQLSNSITLSLEWYPWGRDVDRFLPLWKDWKNKLQHLGISVGISLSKDPLQSYYGGIAICLTKEFNVVAGVNFSNTTKNNQYQITSISSISDLDKYVLGRSYKGSFYVGISLSPSQAIKNLGL